MKLIFVTAEKGDAKEVGKMLGAIRQTEYYFIVVPKNLEFLTKEELEAMLHRVHKD